MEWKDWEPHYNRIVERLALDPQADRNATLLLDSLLKDHAQSPVLRKLEEIIENKSVVICGAGPSLEQHLKTTIPSKGLTNVVYVASDGAASALLEFDYKCDILVTDLDGDPDALREVIRRGAIPIVHAHGDNMDKVSEFVPALDAVLGSTQVEPTEHVFLWGGFTDGDRACYLVSHYNPACVFLAGMDFGAMVGRWSKPGHRSNFVADERKREKLAIARELISDLKSHINLDIILLD
ncbi:MAG: 6-hydroxymethylpterin diphosphokinase MptE-like protein [Candidatus Thorarchaeota archaeon]